MSAMRTAVGAAASPAVASTSGRCSQAAACAPFWSAAAGRQPQQQRSAVVTLQPSQRQRRRAGVAAAAGSDDDMPDWFRNMQETADLDESAARLLAGANGDPSVVQARMKEEQEALYARIMGTQYGGEERPMEVSFRAPVDTFSLWVWIHLYRPPTGTELDTLQEVVNSWFLVGRLGGFNSANLQVLYHQDEALEDLEYDQGEPGAQMPATFHDITPLESQGPWCRFWIDLGTADELALDVLINALSTLSREQLGVRALVFGGENEDWPAPKREEFLPEVTMDPMRGPVQYGADADDDDDEEEEGEDIEELLRRARRAGRAL